MWDVGVRNSAVLAEQRMPVTGVVVIHESRTVRDVPVMVVQHIVSVPIGSPVMPAPAEAAEYTDSNTQAECNPRAIDIEAGDPNPPSAGRQRPPTPTPTTPSRPTHTFPPSRPTP